MKKTIIINERNEEQLVANILSETFYPNADKVLVIKTFLDKTFKKCSVDSIDQNGYPIKEKYVIMQSSNNQPLKQLNLNELLRLLDDKYHKMVSDDNDRKKFFKQIIKDWYMNAIQNNGILTVNYL